MNAHEGCFITESGRILDLGPFLDGDGAILEFINGSWVTANSPVSVDETWYSKVIDKGRYFITDNGRVFDLSPVIDGKMILEYVDGKWVEPVSTVDYCAVYDGRCTSILP